MWMDAKTFQKGLSNRSLNSTAASLLGFLLLGPMTGWDIVAAVEASIGCFWNLTRSQVYRELRSLAAAGFLEAGETGPRDRRPYTITEEGRKAFFDWLRQDPGDDLVRMQGLLKFFFADYLDAATVRRFIMAQRVEHEGRLAYFRSILPHLADEPIRAHTLKFGIAYEEMVLEWLDSMPWETLAAKGEDVASS